MPRKIQYGPWRLVKQDRTYHRFEVYPETSAGMYSIRGVYTVRWTRKIKYPHKWKFDDVQCEQRKEEQRTVKLEEVLQHLKVSDRQRSLVDMVVGGLDTIQQLFNRHQWYEKDVEEKAQRKRRLAHLKKKRLREQAKADDHRSKRVKRNLPTRYVEI